MKQIVDHLEAALTLLKTYNEQAHERYERYEKRLVSHSSRAMREAWYEYRATADMIHDINTALSHAQEVTS